jgi:glycosyltransferase involved in cell wall biosynthesis
MQISIVVPTYNSGKYVERTLDSIFSQGYHKTDVLVVDGGSKDETLNILKRYKIRYPIEFNYIVLPPKGEPDAINQGMKMVNGEVVAFLDSDDTYYPDTLKLVSEYYQKHPDVMWTYGKAHIIDSDDRIIRHEITKVKELFQPRYSYSALLCVDFITQPTVFWRREAWKETGMFNTNYKFSFEYDYWCRLGKKYKPGFINEYLANWRANSQAISEQSGAHVEEAWQAYKIATGYSGFWLKPLQWVFRNLQIATYLIVGQRESIS